MICPKDKYRTEVLETTQRDAPVTRRRRHCLKCGHRFTTVETLVKDAPMVIVGGLERSMRRGIDVQAVAAAIAVDRRKIKIAREQREKERYADEHEAPRHLRGDTLRYELKGHR